MTPSSRRLTVIIVAIALTCGAGAYGATAYFSYQQRVSAPSEAETVTADTSMGANRIVFRNTANGTGYGQIAEVPLDDPDGPRKVIPIACDRVDATATAASCLRIDRGVVTSYSATLYNARWTPVQSWPLAGIPSRTRLSPDSTLIASTAFVTGHDYMTLAFSTETKIEGADGHDYGNLEDWNLTVDGKPLTAVDRNMWGVTFASDDKTFYATAASGGHTWLMKGDLATKTLTSIHGTVECPSLSPDETRIAFKKNVSKTTTPDWRIAVLDLATDAETVLPEARSVDDQVEWLDDKTLLYGMPNDTVGDDDVWSIPADGSGNGSILIHHAWSPAVVR